MCWPETPAVCSWSRGSSRNPWPSLRLCPWSRTGWAPQSTGTWRPPCCRRRTGSRIPWNIAWSSSCRCRCPRTESTWWYPLPNAPWVSVALPDALGLIPLSGRESWTPLRDLERTPEMTDTMHYSTLAQLWGGQHISPAANFYVGFFCPRILSKYHCHMFPSKTEPPNVYDHSWGRDLCENPDKSPPMKKLMTAVMYRDRPSMFLSQ